MQVIENTNVKEKLYIEKLENGLTVMIIPKTGIRKKYVMKIAKMMDLKKIIGVINVKINISVTPDASGKKDVLTKVIMIN